MGRRCILHVGLAKTGSTSIQKAFCSASECLLANHGIGYHPDIENHSVLVEFMMTAAGGRNRPYAAFAKRNRHKMRMALSTDQSLPSTEEYFANYLSSNGSRVEIISGEVLAEGQSIEAVHHLHGFLRQHFETIDVVAYVRPLFAWTNSRAQQRLKGGGTFQQIKKITNGFISGEGGNPKDSLNPKLRDWLEPYIQVFGAQNVQIVDGQREALFNGDVVADFAHRMLGADLEILNVEAVSSNESLGMVAAYVLESINRQYPQDRNKSENPKRARGLVGRLREYPKTQQFVVPGIDWAGLRAAYQDDIAWLYSITNGRIDYRDEPLPEVQEPPWTSAMDPVAAHLNDALLRGEINAARLRLHTLWPEVVDTAPGALALDGTYMRYARWLPHGNETIQIAKRLERVGQPHAALDLLNGTVHMSDDPKAVEKARRLMERIGAPTVAS